MLIQKTGPVGIDLMIQKFQEAMHAELMPKWNLDPTVALQNKLYECNCRCNRNRTKTGYIAETLIPGSAKDYKEVYWKDTLNAVSFFGISGTENYKVGEVTPVHLVFFVDLKKLKPTIAHRADEEVRKDVQLFAQQEMFGFKYISTEQWIENVLREYKGSYAGGDRLTAVDMQPVHCFRLNFELHYRKINC